MSGITPEARADKVLPVDRKALAEWFSNNVGTNGTEAFEYADDLIASPVLRALAEAVWDECAAWHALEGGYSVQPLVAVRSLNPYREQAR